MKNAFSRTGRTCASLVAGGFLMTGALLAGSADPGVTVTLPHAVTIGSTTLQSGHYNLSMVDAANGNEYFTVSGENSPTVMLPARRIDADKADKTQVVLSTDGAAWRLDRLFIQGQDAGYQFVNVK